MKTDCIRAASISPYLDGELSTEETERVRLHLKTCTACQNRFEKLSAINLHLAALTPIAPCPDFDRTFFQELDRVRETQRQTDWRQWISGDRLRGWRPALATAAGVLILCGTLLFSHRPQAIDFSPDEIVMAQNLELLDDYEIVRHLDLLEHWTDFSEENDETDA